MISLLYALVYSAYRVLLKEKGKPSDGPNQQARGLASLFGPKPQTPKLFRALLGNSSKEGIGMLLKLKIKQADQVTPQQIQ